MIKAIVFDLDDTLYSEYDYIKSGYKVVGKWIEKEYGVSGFYEIAIRSFNLGERKKVFDKTLGRLNIQFNDELIRRMIEIYRTHYPNIRMYDDAIFVLDHLKDNMKVGLITDGFLSSQEKKVNALKIKEAFHAIVLTDSFGKEFWKPNPFPYFYLKKLLNVSHNECVYIGDNPKKDFVTAKKLGWKTVQIKRKNSFYSRLPVKQDYKADYQVNDLRNIFKINELSHTFNNRGEDTYAIKNR